MTPTDALVDRFAAALKEKLNAAREKYGYHNENWMHVTDFDELREEMLNHLHKGDPRDVAAFCAMLWHHGEGTKPPTTCGNKELRILLAQLGNIKFNSGQNVERLPRAKDVLFEMLERIISVLSMFQISGDPTKVGCEACEFTGRINCDPDEDGHTHPCDTCNHEALMEFNRGVQSEKEYARRAIECEHDWQMYPGGENGDVDMEICADCHIHRDDAVIKLSLLPADWMKDSSLKTWFPITAEELERLRAVAPPTEISLQDLHDVIERQLSYTSAEKALREKWPNGVRFKA